MITASLRRVAATAAAATLLNVSATAAFPLAPTSAAAGETITFRGMSLTLPAGGKRIGSITAGSR